MRASPPVSSSSRSWSTRNSSRPVRCSHPCSCVSEAAREHKPPGTTRYMACAARAAGCEKQPFLPSHARLPAAAGRSSDAPPRRRSCTASSVHRR
eukprot:2291017-Prymnesium_polylepis.1